jgi:hypothetical protein
MLLENYFQQSVLINNSHILRVNRCMNDDLGPEATVLDAQLMTGVHFDDRLLTPTLHDQQVAEQCYDDIVFLNTSQLDHHNKLTR